MPSLKWSIMKSVPAYSNISKKCQLCLQEKFEILNYSNPNELLNKIRAHFKVPPRFSCRIINLMIIPYEKCSIRYI